MFSILKFLVSFLILLVSVSLVDGRLASMKTRSEVDAKLVRRADQPAGVVSGLFAAYRWDAKVALANISWVNYTQMNYGYAETTHNIATWSIYNETLLPEFVSLAQKNKVKAGLALGGYDGSRWFSSHMATASNRTALIKSVVSLVNKYKLDAIDFDWQFQGTAGIGCNVFSKKDTANFLSFLQELRKDSVGAKLTLSAHTSLAPFTNAENIEMSDFASSLNYIVVMAYNVWENSWAPTVGPNAPLASACAPKGSRIGSATSAVKKWTEAGFNANQIVLGLATYGRGYSVNHTSTFTSGDDDEIKLYANYNRTARPYGDVYDRQTAPAGKKDVCGKRQAPGGTFTFRNMIQEGYLQADGTPAENVVFKYDNCSQTAIVYDEHRQMMISYDNADSFAAKAKFVKTNKLGGVSVWEQSGDSDNHILMNALFASDSDLASTVQNNAKDSKPYNSSPAKANGPGGLQLWTMCVSAVAVLLFSNL